MNELRDGMAANASSDARRRSGRWCQEVNRRKAGASVKRFRPGRCLYLDHGRDDAPDVEGDEHIMKVDKRRGVALSRVSSSFRLGALRVHRANLARVRAGWTAVGRGHAICRRGRLTAERRRHEELNHEVADRHREAQRGEVTSDRSHVRGSDYIARGLQIRTVLP